jgi:hypothetical protein
MKTMLVVALMLLTLVVLSVKSHAAQFGFLPDHYFRGIDVAHPEVAMGFDIAPKDLSQTTGITSLALITHSDKDGTLIPERLQAYIPPVSWAPLAVGFGGSFKQEVVLDIGTSANVSPAVAKLLMRGVDSSTTGWAAAIKRALEGESKAQIGLGVSLGGSWVKDGVFKSMKQMFPGCGPLEIVGNAARLSVNGGWKF